jgi:hypothetical protein
MRDQFKELRQLLVPKTERILLLPACSSSACANGIFNYVGSYSSSAWFRWNALQAAKASGKQGDYAKVTKDVIYIDTLDAIASQLGDQKKWSYTYGNDTMIHWGAYIPNSSGSDPGMSWVPNILNHLNDDDWQGNEKDQIIWMLKSYDEKGNLTSVAVVYTINQATYWGSVR